MEKEIQVKFYVHFLCGKYSRDGKNFKEVLILLSWLFHNKKMLLEFQNFSLHIVR